VRALGTIVLWLILLAVGATLLFAVASLLFAGPRIIKYFMLPRDQRRAYVEKVQRDTRAFSDYSKEVENHPRKSGPARCSSCHGTGQMVISEKQMGTCPVCSGGSWR
jgi:hypothetical protein